MSRGTHSFFWTPGAAAVGGSSVVEPRVTRDIGHYRHRRFSCRRVGASTGVIEEPNAVLVRSRVPRTGAAFGRRAEVPRVRSRDDYDGGARPHAVARRARASLPASPLAVAPPRTSRASAGVLAVRRGGRGGARAGGGEQRLAARRAQRVGGGRGSDSESAGRPASFRGFSKVDGRNGVYREEVEAEPSVAQLPDRVMRRRN